MNRQFIVIDNATGNALEFCISPMSGKPCFGWVPVERATRFDKFNAYCAIGLLTFLMGADCYDKLNVKEFTP